MSEHTLNIPQLVVIIIITAIVFRWYFGKSSSGTATGTRQPSRQSARRINPAHVDQIAQMFPQLDRRQIMWDLHRNGGNLQATTERVLSGRGLETPPQTFQPQPPTPQPGTPTTGSRTATPVLSKPSHPDLITRYNLSSKLNEESSTESTAESQKKSGWSQNKSERQLMLQKRREEMILAARRKLMEKDKAKETTS